MKVFQKISQPNNQWWRYCLCLWKGGVIFR